MPRPPALPAGAAAPAGHPGSGCSTIMARYGILLLAGQDALHLGERGHLREAIDPKHDRFAGPGDPGLADCFRLSAVLITLGDVVDADRPPLDETLHVTLCDDALAGLDVDAKHTLGILHAADVLEGWIVVTHGVSHHIVIDGRYDILPPCGVKVIRNYLLCIYAVYFAEGFRPCGRLPGLRSLRSGDALTAFGGGLRSADRAAYLNILKCVHGF